MSLDEQLPQFPGQPGEPGYPDAPPQPQRTSGLAITGFILAFLLPGIGFILSLIAVFKTGAGKAKGRGLAIAGIIISVVIMGVLVVVVVAASKSTVADPGCVAGKEAILNGAKDPSPDSLKSTINDLNAAAAKAKHSDVRDAMKTLADDYNTLLTGAANGKIPAGIQTKIGADGDKIDSLCSFGS